MFAFPLSKSSGVLNVNGEQVDKLSASSMASASVRFERPVKCSTIFSRASILFAGLDLAFTLSLLPSINYDAKIVG